MTIDKIYLGNYIAMDDFITAIKKIAISYLLILDSALFVHSIKYRNYNTSRPFDFLEYHVKARNTNNLYSDMSNIVSVIGERRKSLPENLGNTELKIEVPTKTSVANNYPNPFNPSTKIQYQLTESGFVSLKVYDILGNEVAELVNEFKDAGYYSIRFEASSLNVELTSGVYIYTLRVNNFASSKKMLLAK